jgi:hypothetical protein
MAYKPFGEVQVMEQAPANPELAEIQRKAKLRTDSIAAQKASTGLANEAVSAKQQAAAKMLSGFDQKAQADSAKMSQQAAEGLATNAGQSGGFGGYGALLQSAQQTGQGLANLGLQQSAERGSMELQQNEGILSAKQQAAKALQDQLSFETEVGGASTDELAMKNEVDAKLASSTAAHASDWTGEQDAVASEMEAYASSLPEGAAKQHALYLAKQVRDGSIDV